MRQLISLIPARGGSKGVKKKNIRNLAGKPLIAHTIEAALACPEVEKVYVSTDCQEIADVAVKYGAEVPFLRPAELAGDQVTDLPVIQHFIQWLEDNDELAASVAYLRPTTPFKTAAHISACYKKLQDHAQFTGIRTVTQSEGVFHPYWMFKPENNILTSFVEGIDLKDYGQRQLLPACLRLNGVVDLFKTKNLAQNTIYGDAIGFHLVEEQEAIDIDTEMDFLLCEFMISRKYK